MPARRYRFVFDSPLYARIYAERVAHKLRNVALYRHENVVYVLDGVLEGDERDQREEIIRLAHFSGGTYTAADLPPKTE